MARVRRLVPWWLLALVFVVIPVLEIYLLIQVGQVIGAWWTVLLLIASGVLGSYLMKREGQRAWLALREALAQHRMPARELADGALILIGGTLLVTPGFVTDAVGLLCALPWTRPLARRVLTRLVARKLLAGANVSFAGFAASGSESTDPEHDTARRRPGTDESVIRGEVVD